MICPNCGIELSEGTAFCTSCGTPLNAAPQTPPPFVPPATMPGPMTNWKNSYFDGGLLGMIGVNLAVAFLSVISFGFAWPALWCFYLRWIYKHTVVGGYRLKFTGKGLQLFGKALLWVFLSAITFGIYGLWVPIKYQKWATSHIEIDSVVVNR